MPRVNEEPEVYNSRSDRAVLKQTYHNPVYEYEFRD